MKNQFIYYWIIILVSGVLLGISIHYQNVVAACIIGYFESALILALIK